MKIKYKEKPFNEILKYKPRSPGKPLRPNAFYKWLLKAVTSVHLGNVNFKYELEGFDKYKNDEPIFILINHASFIDIELGAVMFQPRPLNIVASTDAFIRKNWIMRRIGCVPAKRFAMDISMIKNMLYCVRTLKDSVLMYPEAGYSISGKSSVIPSALGKMVKLMDIPLAVCITEGAYQYQPMYNKLHKHKINVKAKAKILLTKEQVQSLSVDEINEILKKEFSLDYWKWQKDNNILIKENNMVEGLDKLLYKCPHCHSEGTMNVINNKLLCSNCYCRYEMRSNGELHNLNGETIYNSVSDWFDFEREEVKKEIENGTYKVICHPDIYIQFDSYKVFKVKDSNAKLVHDLNGYVLTDSNNNIEYKVLPIETYTTYAELDWFEVGDMISLRNAQIQYNCIVKHNEASVIKIRLASEELYKMTSKKN